MFCHLTTYKLQLCLSRQILRLIVNKFNSNPSVAIVAKHIILEEQLLLKGANSKSGVMLSEDIVEAT